MAGSSTKALFRAIDLRLSEVVREVLVGLVGAGGGIALALTDPARLIAVAPIAVGLVGVVIGAVVAAIAVIAAFLDGPFLRKLHTMDPDTEPTYYFGPFLLTAVLGVAGGLVGLVTSALPATLPVGWLAGAGSLLGLLTFWTLASLASGLATLTEFVLLKGDAAQVPDVEPAPTRQPTEQRRAG